MRQWLVDQQLSKQGASPTRARTEHYFIDAPWDDVPANCDDLYDNAHLKPILLDAYKILKATLTTELNVSLKPFVLQFDKY